MADAYCSSCGHGLSFSDQYCGRCGASAGAADGDATRTEDFSQYRPESPPPYPFPVGPPTQPAPRLAPSRRYSPALLIAVAAVVVAAIAATVTLIVVSGNSDQTPVAIGTSAGRSVVTNPSTSPSSAPTTTPTFAQPQIVTVTSSATLSATNPPAGGEPAPLSTSQLRSFYEAGTPVSPFSYEDADSDVRFSSPSRNIECYIVAGAGVQCAISRYDFPQPGPDCNYGAFVSVDANGDATYSGCVTSPFVPGGKTLAYGASVTDGTFGCVSKPVGISCVDEATDTGFTVSRQEFIPVN